jgi:hypothetical protein
MCGMSYTPERRNMQVEALLPYTVTLQQNAHVCIRLKAKIMFLIA